MRRYLYFIFILFIAFSFECKAQVLKPVPIRFSQQNKYAQPPLVFKLPLIKKAKANTPPVQAYNLKCTFPKGAIFCRMEDAIYSKLNFWVKFRMGTDDRYSN